MNALGTLPCYFCKVILLLDNYDSFTYNLCDYLQQCGAEVDVVRNDLLDVKTVSSKYDAIVISPGPGEPLQAGCTMEVIEKYADQLPIFGVCLGMQAIGLHFGADLVRAHFPMHGKESTLNFNVDHQLFTSISSPFNVCRYHSLILQNLQNTPLNIIAETAAGEPMAIAHSTLPIWAVQFHPEAILTPQGLQLIKNWLTCFNL